MSDKIEEIRDRVEQDVAKGPANKEVYRVHKDRAFLLAEVDRLRADLATQQGCCDGAAAQDAHVRQEREERRAEVEKLRAEIERLREALQEAACACPSFEYHCASTWARQDGCAHMTARKALEGNP